ncbi:hypothetical protein [Chryseobacterium balustinum]|uniref:DUF4595 domain-containing protein n=1 Tax=Chryseobacterium balustinum TaxID=246 RepID=A0AAX2IQH8_9FLAO|nr:hypothetical protein [Chryseobacterium balustinum]AZB30849.1 hypothetical protein EB354_17210 [Chryseobacterium balustinum]SKB43258.1 hypothetical protein SAMN05421800_101725 [Chryseobacterium balustinum]SQA91929.1 Uncharacterised protein [Chryseobacterium balustinum]
MKKFFYFLFILGIISCANSDDILENQQVLQDLEPNKAFVNYMEFPKLALLYPSWYYTFNYQNGNLTKMTGKLVNGGTLSSPDIFYPDSFISLSYNNNQVEVKDSESPYTKTVYTMENSRPKKSEYYQYYVDIGEQLEITKTYMYEANTIAVYENFYNGNKEIYTTYFFDSNKNLIKSEKLEKTYGVNNRLKITNYSDFDNAKNPFKKMFLINDNLYEKSLSANNFRAIESIIQYLPNPLNGNVQLPPGKESANWTYQYDSNGQVLLYHPL